MFMFDCPAICSHCVLIYTSSLYKNMLLLPVRNDSLYIGGRRGLKSDTNEWMKEHDEMSLTTLH